MAAKFAEIEKAIGDHYVEGIGGYVELGDSESIEIHSNAIKLTGRNKRVPECE